MNKIKNIKICYYCPLITKTWRQIDTIITICMTVKQTKYLLCRREALLETPNIKDYKWNDMSLKRLNFLQS